MDTSLRHELMSWIADLDDGELDVVVLFGSVAAGRVRPESDVDLYLRLRPGVRWEIGRRLELAARGTLRLDREVDLVVEDETTSVLLRMKVARDGLPLWESRPGAWDDLRVAAMKAYTDLEPYLRRIGEAVRANAVRHA